MKESIIKQMTEVVRDKMRDFQSDFYEHDLKELDNYEGKFLWFVGSSHTHLAKIDERCVGTLIGNEQFLYSLMQGNTTADYCVNRISFDEVVFFYDGNKMVEINHIEAKRIWKITKDFALFTWQVSNGMKELPNNFKIPIKFTCSLQYVKEQLRFAEELGTDSLIEGLRCFRRRIKINSTHECEVGRDFADHSFTFAFYATINGERKCTLNGGLIFYNGKWNSHT